MPKDAQPHPRWLVGHDLELQREMLTGLPQSAWKDGSDRLRASLIALDGLKHQFDEGPLGHLGWKQIHLRFEVLFKKQTCLRHSVLRVVAQGMLPVLARNLRNSGEALQASKDEGLRFVN